MPDRLREIRSRLDAATLGPWSLGVHPDGSWGNTVIRYTDVHVPDRVTVAEGVVHPDDADFIANAPTDIAWLLSTLEAANERIAILRAEIADLEALR